MVLFCLIQTQLKAQTYLYVSPLGTGSSFTEQEPGSILDAKEKVKELTINMQSDIVVFLRGGRYELPTSLIFNQDDAGNNGFSVVWTAFTGEIPILSGGNQVDNWTLAHDSIWQSSVTGPNFRQLYVDNERAIRARTPDRDNDTDMGPYFRLKSWDIPNKKILINQDDATGIPADGNTEMVIQTHWDQQRVHIASITSTANDAEVKIRNSEDSLYINIWPQREPDQPYFFENSLSFLNKPEEWYYDINAQILYYMPKPGVNPNSSNIYVPRLNEFIVMNGTHDVRFEGIVFEHSGWTDPDKKGIIDVQAVSYLPGMITLKDTKNITIKNSVFRHSGGQGIILQGNTSGNKLLGNLIYDISANPIVIRMAGSNGDYIGHNTIFQSGRDYSGAVAILAQLPTNLVIENNEIYHTPYTGISLGWSWNENITACKNNTVRQNKIHKTMESDDDGGGIYTLGRQDGTVIYENYFNDTFHSPWSQRFPTAGIYTDQGTMNVEIRNNVLDSLEQQFNSNTTFPNNIHDNNYSLQIKQASGPAAEYQKIIPKAIISVDATEGIVPFSIIFNGSKSSDQQNNPLTYEWSFPGGDIETGSSVQYKFENPGVYRVQLKVKNANGLYDVAFQDIVVHAINTDTNLALRKPVKESSEYDSSTTASKGNDNQTSTIWACSVSDKLSWWQVDLGQSFGIKEIQLAARQGDFLTNSRIYFQVWASNSSEMTSPVLLGSQSSSPYPKDGAWYTFPNDQGGYRYLRILKPGGGHWYFSEFRAFGNQKAPIIPSNNDTINKFKVFPNPANSVVNIESADLTQNSYPIIYSIQGKTVTTPYRFSEGQLQLQTSGLKDGMYLLSVICNSKREVFRFIILH